MTNAETPPPRPRGPRFSVATILYVVLCVAVALTIAAEQPRQNFGFNFYQPHIELSYALRSLATIGLATALLQQARRLRGESWAGLNRVLRVGLAASLAALLGIQLLLQRGVFAFPERGGFLTVFVEVFPDAVGMLLLIVAASVVGQRETKPGLAAGRRTAAVAVLVVVACFGHLLFIASDLSGISFLVQIACNGIESAQAGRFQRHGYYPSHLSEGFFSYRMAAIAVAVLGATAFAAGVAVLGQSRSARWAAAIGTIAGLAALTAYNLWYYSIEFPRIAPDLATPGLAANAVDLFGGVLLLGAVSLWASMSMVRGAIASKAVCRIDNSGSLGRAPVFLAAAGLIAAGGLDTVEALISATDANMINAFLGQPSSPIFMRLIEGCAYLLKTPTWLLSIAQTCLGVRVGWMLWRREEPVAIEIPARRVAVAWLLTSAVLLAAAPTLAAYGFCSWLGPWWR